MENPITFTVVIVRILGIIYAHGSTYDRLKGCALKQGIPDDEFLSKWLALVIRSVPRPNSADVQRIISEGNSVALDIPGKILAGYFREFGYGVNHDRETYKVLLYCYTEPVGLISNEEWSEFISYFLETYAAHVISQ